MSDQALLITAGGGVIVIVLLSWLWWRMSRRNRGMLGMEVGKSTRQEFDRRRPRS